MNLFTLPWLEISFVIPVIGAMVLSLSRDIDFAARCSMVSSIATFVSAVFAFVASGVIPNDQIPNLCQDWLNQSIFRLDKLSGPLPAVVALLFALTVLATPRLLWNRASLSALLLVESLQLATFSCIDPATLVVLLAVGVIPPAVKLLVQGKPARVFIGHMLIFVTLLFSGWYGIVHEQSWGVVVLALALLLRTGIVPGHLWFVHLVEHASLSTSLLFMASLPGVYAAIRLVMPYATSEMLDTLGHVGLFTAIYSAGLATVQRDLRRFFAYVFLSHSALIIVGLESHTPTSLTGAMTLWIAMAISQTGLCLSLRAVEARFGRIDLSGHHGLYSQAPALAVGFLLTGLASVGFPGTLSFVASEILIDGLMTSDPVVGIGLVLAAAINGIAIVRVYLLVFTGKSLQPSLNHFEITQRERWVILSVSAMILASGLYPKPLILDRHLASEQALKNQH